MKKYFFGHHHRLQIMLRANSEISSKHKERILTFANGLLKRANISLNSLTPTSPVFFSYEENISHEILKSLGKKAPKLLKEVNISISPTANKKIYTVKVTFPLDG